MWWVPADCKASRPRILARSGSTGRNGAHGWHGNATSYEPGNFILGSGKVNGRAVVSLLCKRTISCFCAWATNESVSIVGGGRRGLHASCGESESCRSPQEPVLRAIRAGSQGAVGEVARRLWWQRHGTNPHLKDSQSQLAREAAGMMLTFVRYCLDISSLCCKGAKGSNKGDADKSKKSTSRPAGDPVSAPTRMIAISQCLNTIPVCTAGMGVVAGLPAARYSTYTTLLPSNCTT